MSVDADSSHISCSICEKVSELKAANNPCGVGASFCLVGEGFALVPKTGGTNSVRMKRSENAAFWIVPNVIVASHHTPIPGGFKYRDSYRLAVA